MDFKHKYLKYKSKYLQLKGGQSNKYYYHGSPLKLDVLKPMSKRTLVVKGESVVFATNTRWLAIFFIAQGATDADIELGFIDGIPYILEQYEGAFDKFLKGSGYLHYVDPKYFKSDKRLGMPNHEFISYQEVPILKVDEINDIYDELKKEDVVMLSWKNKERILLNELKNRYNKKNKLSRYLYYPISKEYGIPFRLGFEDLDIKFFDKIDSTPLNIINMKKVLEFYNKLDDNISTHMIEDFITQKFTKDISNNKINKDNTIEIAQIINKMNKSKKNGRYYA